MKTEEEIRSKLREYQEKGHRYRECTKTGEILDHYHYYQCQAWLTAVQGLVHQIFRSTSDPYRAKIDLICGQNDDVQIPLRVGQVNEILGYLIADLDDGWFFSIEDQARAGVFENLLEQAKSYAKSKRHCEAGVLSAAVFEDVLRSLCRKNDILENGVRISKLISILRDQGVFSKNQEAQALAFVRVRNSALHCHWDEFNLGEVERLVSFDTELVGLLKSV